MTTYEPAIHFKDVRYSIDGKPIVGPITGSFPAGRITTLVGPSGAGKTTVLKLCNGLLSADSGEILVQGEPVGSMEPTALRRKVGMALQDAPMVNGSVYDNLALPLRLQKMELSESDAVSWLGDVGLSSDYLHKKATELSGGQRQKVSIARTLVNHSDILLMDEITSALDRGSRREIESLITQINEKYGTTIIWITHNLEQAISIGDYTWVLIAGELIETGESRILEDPSDERVRRFVRGELQ
ncbi:MULTISPECIES: phosphate ABC transporter ATP-binding protein [Bhargavaea]|uniref:Phosphate ABC transporter ATP-binding protein n=1 Tax=Bhargavaea changchunensis TaxID=2134037 RepID=A0ABW2NH88_9BACL|nr:phosphate ABC transporter ATP-binding protein [Bhargavaea sp. CC-171006]